MRTKTPAEKNCRGFFFTMISLMHKIVKFNDLRLVD